MTTTLVAMLIWVGGNRGGAAVLPGFGSLAACEAARPAVEATYKKSPAEILIGQAWTACIELSR